MNKTSPIQFNSTHQQTVKEDTCNSI